MSAAPARTVYFLKPVGMEGPIKIGCTVNLHKRLHELMNASPVDLEVIATAPGNHNIERRLHRLLIDTHFRQEWFHPSAKLAEIIAAVIDGSFDPLSLPDDGRPVWYEYHAIRNREGKARRSKRIDEAKRERAA